MVRLVQSTNGTMTLDDLKNYKVIVKQPLTINYRGYNVFTTEAPSSGAVCLAILKAMEQFPLEDISDLNLSTHRFDEVMRFAYGARQQLGDPAYIRNIDIEQYQKYMLSEEKARDVRSRIRDDRTLPVKDYMDKAVYTSEGHGTSHIVTADSSGLTVTSTTTVNILFGAQIMTADTGIIM